MKMIGSKTPTEIVPVTFDFSAVVSGTVATKFITASLISGPDPGAASLTLGSPVEAGGIVSLLVSNGIQDCSYELLCAITDSAGREHELAVAMTTTTAAA